MDRPPPRRGAALVRREAGLSPTLLGLLAILLWGASLPVVRGAQEGLGPLTVAGLVQLGGGLLALGGTRLRGLPAWPERAPRAWVLASGGLFLAYFACLYLGLGLAADRRAALGVALLNYLWPALTLALSVPILGLAWRWPLVPGLAVAALAAALAGGGGPEALGALARDPLPAALGLGAGITWALYSTLSRRLAGGARGSLVPALLVLTGAGFLAARALVGEQSAWSAGDLLAVGALSAMTAGGYLGWDEGVRRGDVALLAVASNFTPLLSALAAALWLGVAPGARLWAAAGLLGVGALLCRAGVRGGRPEG